MPTKIVPADIVTAFSTSAIGTKVTDQEGFFRAILPAIEAHDFSADRVPGQAFIEIPAAIPFVSSGVGKRNLNPHDYVTREHRGRVNAYLRRELAAPVEGLAIVVYTKEAYFKDPDVTLEEAGRIDCAEATHVLVAVLAFAGPKAPLTPLRFVANLAGGNREAQVWGADEIRAKALEIVAYDDAWATVAD
jgi:hypothetical protein